MATPGTQFEQLGGVTAEGGWLHLIRGQSKLCL
jgi:hypothetical protein